MPMCSAPTTSCKPPSSALKAAAKDAAPAAIAADSLPLTEEGRLACRLLAARLKRGKLGLKGLRADLSWYSSRKYRQYTSEITSRVTI